MDRSVPYTCSNCFKKRENILNEVQDVSFLVRTPTFDRSESWIAIVMAGKDWEICRSAAGGGAICRLFFCTNRGGWLTMNGIAIPARISSRTSRFPGAALSFQN